MPRLINLLFTTFVLSTSTLAAPQCDHPDSNFRTFLKRFKNNSAFQATRLITPLELNFTDPEGTKKERISLKQIRVRKLQIIRDDKFAVELKGTEGQLCEGDPVVTGNQAKFSQYSCNTDVYSSAYYFIRTNGCWYLQRADHAGG